MREGNKEYFYKNLDRYFPGMKERYRLKYGNDYFLLSDDNNELMELFHSECKKRGIVSNYKEVFEYLWEFPTIEEDKYVQLSLF